MTTIFVAEFARERGWGSGDGGMDNVAPARVGLSANIKGKEISVFQKIQQQHEFCRID